MSIIDPPFVAETLRWCNEMRAERGLNPLPEMPLGIKTDPVSCPCGRASGLYVEEEEYTHSRDDWYRQDLGLRFPLPGAVIDFVRAFDAGLLPQYEEEVLDDPDQY